MKLPRTIKVHYLPVQVMTYAPILPEEMRRYHLLAVNEPTDIKLLFDSLNKINKQSEFRRLSSRLFIEATASTPEYWMDTEGNVRRGKDEYQIAPRAFLNLVYILDQYLIKSQQKP